MDLPQMDLIYIAFGIFLLATAYNYLKPKENRKYDSITVEEAMDKMKSDTDLFIIDVRRKEEYQIEHIRKATNIPLDKIENRLKKISRNKDILIYCQTGARSIRAIRKLEINGYSRLFHMHQGLRVWKQRGFPTTGSHVSK